MYLWMPYIPISFDRVLDSPSFSPHPFPSTPSLPASNAHLGHDTLARRFSILAKSIMYQIVSATAYLHDDSRGIAHRDIKPRNVLLTEDGCVRLIDFGIAWKSGESEETQRGDLWPERSDQMCAAVSTGPYRAPELLFSPKSYNAFATDLWSLGATFAEFFTSLELIPTSDDQEEEGYAEAPQEEDNSHLPFIAPYSVQTRPDARWFRTSLFNGRRGELGLIWSIFKVFGTPTDETWPGFKELTSTRSVVFRDVPPVPLISHLPNLPPPIHEANGALDSPSPRNSSKYALDLVSRLLVYPPEKRLKAQEALSHPWFTTTDTPLLLPPNYPLQDDSLETHITAEWRGKSLGKVIQEILSHDEDEE
ncbi:hypothetical protein AX17_000817 [Amanita inopinata Kibby_2008]|nr:hypothetical protein AX17_000817 [Amanita inopinata Kibby_2008]